MKEFREILVVIMLVLIPIFGLIALVWTIIKELAIIEVLRNIMKTIFRFVKARLLGVPFTTRVWYNFRAMLSKRELSNNSFVEIFDEDGRYIDCPSIGGTLVYNIKGKRYIYEVIGFKNESRYRDWLYDTDYINPIIRFVKPV